MERIKALIYKLQQQAEQQGDIAAMLVTAQLLQAELAKAHAAQPVAVTGPSKISVVMPGGNNPFYSSYKSNGPENAALHALPVESEAAVPKEIKAAKNPVTPAPEPATDAGWLPDPLAEMPPLAEQKKEMNEVLGKPATSINDRLKTERTELGAVLTEAPVKDLKKAIGINDRFVFLNELFRGDEVMYERSIKTINNFRAYPEAEYWIERELKIKLAWDENRESVKYFRQLVRRRFI